MAIFPLYGCIIVGTYKMSKFELISDLNDKKYKPG